MITGNFLIAPFQKGTKVPPCNIIKLVKHIFLPFPISPRTAFFFFFFWTLEKIWVCYHFSQSILSVLQTGCALPIAVYGILESCPISSFSQFVHSENYNLQGFNAKEMLFFQTCNSNCFKNTRISKRRCEFW